MEPADAALERMRRDIEALLPPRNSNTASLTVNAGGVGVWMALTACLVMAALNAALLFTIAGHDRKIERMQDHLNAIYMMAPHLKPEKQPSAPSS